MRHRTVRRGSSSLLAVAMCFAAAQTALADTPPSFLRLVERERPTWLALREILPPTPRPTGAPPLGPPPLEGHIDLLHQATDATLDPATGAVVATYVAQLAGMGGGASLVRLLVDPGIDVTDASCPSSPVTHTSQVASGYRVVEIAFADPVADGETAELTVSFAGTLTCSDPELCTTGPSFSHYTRGSLFPALDDPLEQAPVLDLATHEVTLHVPESARVVMTGEPEAESVEGGTRSSRWAIRAPFSKDLGFYAFVGDVGTLEVVDRPTPTFCVFEPPQGDIDVQRRDWTAGALELVEAMAGRPLPFDDTLSLVRLPSGYDDPGTATYAMTLLSEDYATAGDLLHEETWAHENAHLFWGILVPELTFLDSRLLSEGLATFTEIDYTYPRHFADMDRDAYLAMRYGVIGVDLRVTEAGKKVPPILLSPEEADGSVFVDYEVYTRWAYLATAALLDHLRVTIGEQSFAEGLSLYVDACFEVGCRVGDLKNAMELATARDLTPFFSRWVTARERTPISVSFVPTAAGADVTLAKPDGEPMSLALDIVLESGQTERATAELDGPSTTFSIETSGPVRAVRQPQAPGFRRRAFGARIGSGRRRGDRRSRRARMRTLRRRGVRAKPVLVAARAAVRSGMRPRRRRPRRTGGHRRHHERLRDSEVTMRLRSLLVLLGCAFATGLPACDDAPVAAPRGPTTSGPAAPTFVADEATGPRVVLRAVEITADRVVLEVVAIASGPLHGAAMRLQFDPAVTAFAGFDTSALFAAPDVMRATEPRPGLVLVALSKLGAALPVDLDGGERTLGTLTFTRAGAGDSRLAWVTERSRLADPGGETIAVSFVGGTVTLP